MDRNPLKIGAVGWIVGQTLAIALTIGALWVGCRVAGVTPQDPQDLCLAALAVWGIGLLMAPIRAAIGTGGGLALGLLTQGGDLWVLKTILGVSWGTGAVTWLVATGTTLVAAVVIGVARFSLAGEATVREALRLTPHRGSQEFAWSNRPASSPEDRPAGVRMHPWIRN